MKESEGIKRILKASECIQKLTSKVLDKVKEIELTPEFYGKCLAFGLVTANFIVDPSGITAFSTILDITSSGFEFAAKKDKDLEGGAKIQAKIENVAFVLEVGTLLLTQNYPLLAVVIGSKVAVPAINKLSNFMSENIYNLNTKSGASYVR